MNSFCLGDKSVIVHFGPPKTGTSAIQNALLTHRNHLLEQGVFYPEHLVDENGVSSGHVWNICDKHSGAITLNIELFSKLISDFKRSHANVLLLSSEFFFNLIEDISNVVKNVVFIGYVRNPIDVLESGYSQSVKRHNNCKAMSLPKKLPLNRYNRFADLAKVEHLDMRLRAYVPAHFTGGTVVSDFCQVLNVKLPNFKAQYINSSYSYEALELKRWFNALGLVNESPQLDLLLQKLSEGKEKYTLIPTNRYSSYQNQATVQINELSKIFSIENQLALIEEVNRTQEKPYLNQSTDISELDRMVIALRDENPRFYEQICLFLRKSVYHPSFYSIKAESIFRHETLLMKLRNIAKYAVSKGKSLFKGTVPHNTPSNLILGIEELRNSLNIPADANDAIVLREMALLAEKNNQISFAYKLMLQANALRPNGPLIQHKLKKYAQILGKKHDKGSK
ncbi:hypothetical protein [Shewanella maritima]|uniref:hypothetical protein n=1 Tax=Shewanella maritima TaxID=2520507 RepID=UPI003735C72B